MTRRQRPNHSLLFATALAGAVLTGCPPEPVPPPVAPTTPLAAKSRAGNTLLDLRELPGRPKLTLVGRQGDPQGALVIAIAAERGPVMGAALAGLLAGRLRAATSSVAISSDGAGIRVRAPLDDDPEMLLRAVVSALAAPVAKGEPGLQEAEARVGLLRQRPLDSPVLEPIVACAGHGLATSRAASWRADATGIAALEAARAVAFVRARVAVAVVGTSAQGELVAEALRDVDGWPEGAPGQTPWPRGAHGAFRSNALAGGAWRLTVALRIGSAVRGAAIARGLRLPSPLAHKLALLQEPWRITRAEATARPRGGCLLLELTPDGVEEATAPAAAASALATIEDDLQAALGEPVDAFEVTREIIEAPTAEDVASRAAWWVLSEPVDDAPVASSALTASAANATVRSADDEALSTAYRKARSARAAPRGRDEPARQGVESGQGHLWVMVANPCALRHEGLWDSGRAALAAATNAQRVDDEQVTVLPWVSASGLGIIAHGGLQRADEPPVALADRVADAAARAYTSLALDGERFERTRRAVLGAFGGERGLALARFAEQAAPGNPGWLAPWGSPSRVAAASLLDARERWADVVRGPRRVAVLANVDAAQGQRAADRVGRWLPPAPTKGCQGQPAPQPVRFGKHRLAGDEDGGTAAIGLPFPSAERGAANLTRAWLAKSLAPARASRVEVEVVGREPVAALLVLLRASEGDLEAAQEEVIAALGGLAKSPPSEADYAGAVEDLREERRRRQGRAEHRLVALWEGDEPEPASYAGWVAWLGKRLRDPNRLVVVTETVPASP